MGWPGRCPRNVGRRWKRVFYFYFRTFPPASPEMWGCWNVIPEMWDDRGNRVFSSTASPASPEMWGGWAVDPEIWGDDGSVFFILFYFARSPRLPQKYGVAGTSSQKCGVIVGIAPFVSTASPASPEMWGSRAISPEMWDDDGSVFYFTLQVPPGFPRNVTWLEHWPRNVGQLWESCLLFLLLPGFPRNMGLLWAQI